MFFLKLGFDFVEKLVTKVFNIGLN
jgi:hypothetical protein